MLRLQIHLFSLLTPYNYEINPCGKSQNFNASSCSLIFWHKPLNPNTAWSCYFSWLGTLMYFIPPTSRNIGSSSASSLCKQFLLPCLLTLSFHGDKVDSLCPQVSHCFISAYPPWCLPALCHVHTQQCTGLWNGSALTLPPVGCWICSCCVPLKRN